MSELRWLTLDNDDNDVRVLTMNRPPVNALGRELVEELTTTLASLEKDEQARCLILRTGGKQFCAGADLKERQTMSQDEVRAYVPKLAAVCNALAALPFPTIASLRGAVLGGGCELALACDIRIAADSTMIGLRETALAIIPGAGGTQRLPRLIGPARAKRWIFTAASYSADEACTDGAIDRVTLADRLDEETREMAAAIAANGPIAVRQAKRAVDEGTQLPLNEGLAVEWRRYRTTIESEDRTEALKAFAEKRTPKFQGR
jgi:methylglutaconyl-CoA hydratase